MSNFIGGYPQITEVGGDDLLPVIQGGELKNATKNNLIGYAGYVIRFAQSGTDTPAITEFQNETGETLSWTRQAVGSYRMPIPTGYTPIIPNSTDFTGSSTSLLVSKYNTTNDAFVYLYRWTDGYIYLEIYNDLNVAVEYSTVLGTSVMDLEIKFFAV
jgi:hypothetical protein